MHADRINRLALTLLGVLALLVGAAGLGASTGLFTRTLEDKTLFDNAVSTYIGRHGSWVWAATAVGCLLLLMVMLRWLLALLLSTDRAGDLLVPGARRQGQTIIRPVAVTSALTGEISTYRGVDSARARLLGDPEDPDLVVHVTLAQSADLAALRHRIETEALTHVRHALDQPALPIQLDLDVSKHTPERVT